MAIQFAIRDPATNGKIFIIVDKETYSTREIYDGISKIGQKTSNFCEQFSIPSYFSRLR